MDRLQAKAQARYAFAEFLGGIGKRCTSERLQVLDMVMDQRKPFKAEELLEQCRAVRGPLICRATLFNTLPLLVQCGLLRRNVHERNVTYETLRSRSQSSARQHLVCNTCGKVHRFDAPELAAWVEAQHFRGFTGDPSTAVVYVYGQCARCRRKQTSRT